MHGDQTGRDGGTKKVREENETLDDLEHNEDGRGCCYQPLLKTNPEAADQSPSKSAGRCATRLDEKRADGVESLRSCEPPESRHFQTIGVFRAL